MDKAVVQHLSVIRRDITSESLKESISSHCNSTFAPLLGQQLEGLAADSTPMAVEGKEPLPLVPLSIKPFTAEADLLLGLETLVYLIDRKELARAKLIADNLFELSKSVSSGFDLTVGRILFFYFRVYELGGAVSQARAGLLAAYRSATVQHAPARQAVLINLILRCYFLQGLTDQAAKFAAKITFPETRSNAEFARYLYYLGMIKAVQLEYSESHSCLTQAVRKAPQTSAVGTGFKLAALKASIVVELLIGQIPDRAVFNKQPELLPYFQITQAVRKGDVTAFGAILVQHEAVFVKDRLWSLVRRLHQNVIKAGLKSITTSYSRITLDDVAAKLGLASAAEAADVASKAITDRVIDAHINFQLGHLESSWGGDVYSTCEPAKQLHKRIAFCLQLHADAVKAMEYPDVNELEKELMETNEQILKAQKLDMEDLADDDDDDLMM